MRCAVTATWQAVFYTAALACYLRAALMEWHGRHGAPNSGGLFWLAVGSALWLFPLVWLTWELSS